MIKSRENNLQKRGNPQADTSIQEGEIDHTQRVVSRQLYGLTQAEIDIVEGVKKKCLSIRKAEANSSQ